MVSPFLVPYETFVRNLSTTAPSKANPRKMEDQNLVRSMKNFQSRGDPDGCLSKVNLFQIVFPLPA